MYKAQVESLAAAKSDEESKEYRDVGNQFYRKKEFAYALIYYNKSIAYARSQIFISLAYANRSAVYFELKYYNDCLKNIQWARENKYPKIKSAKLDEREEKCKKLIKEGAEKQLNPWEFFKLSHPANKKIPWIVDCIEVRYTEKYGRGMYASKDLKAGDIISMEEPIPILQNDAFYGHCFSCFKTVRFNLIPCRKTASLMFCSSECKEEMYEKALDIQTVVSPDMRVLSEIAASFGGPTELDKFIRNEKWSVPKKTIFDFDFSDPINNPNYKKNLMMCLLSLNVGEEISVSGKPHSRKFVSKETVRHMISIYMLNKMKANYFGTDYINCQCIPLFMSLINHSCLSNADVVLVDNKLVTVILIPVKKDQQIFINYMGQYSKSEMMQLMQFKCDCDYCTKKIKPHTFSMNPIPLVYCFNKEYDKARDYMHEAWKIVNNNPAYHNCWSKYSATNYSILADMGASYTIPSYDIKGKEHVY